MSERRYGRYGGNPLGHPEDKTCCIENLHDRYHPGGYQCTRPRGHGPDGLYCKQHDPAAVAARQAASMAKYRAQMDDRMKPYRDRDRYKAALQAIADGHNDPRSLAIEALAGGKG